MASRRRSSDQPIPQAGVSASPVRDLPALMPVLATLSAEDVVPTTVIQMEQLGSFFRINGPYAAAILDLLRRGSDTRLPSINAVIGWKKGDTASIISQTTGGQAVALLCFCLRNIYKEDRCGEILYDLCDRLIPSPLSVSSMKQLDIAASLLSAKSSALGFGNILARQVARIQDAYRQLNIPIPDGLFDMMTRDGIVELLVAISAVFRDDNCTVWIYGTQSMAHTAAIVSIMFPDDVYWIVEDFAFQEDLRKRIIIGLVSQDRLDGTTHVLTEYKMQSTLPEWLALSMDPKRSHHPKFPALPYAFEWQGHAGDLLLLAFAQFGLTCSQTLLAACADAVVAFAAKLAPDKKVHFTSGGFFALLGPNPVDRLRQTCHSLLRVSPSEERVDLQSAYSKLCTEFNNSVGSTRTCSCPSDAYRPIVCPPSNGWARIWGDCRQCVRCSLWGYIGVSISRVMLCSLVNAAANVVVHFDDSLNIMELSKPSPRNEASGYHYLDDKTLYDLVMRLSMDPNTETPRNPLAISNFSATMYPFALRDLRRDVGNGYRFELCDGQILYKGHPYPFLDTQEEPPEGSSALNLFEALPNSDNQILPSSAGQHEHLRFTYIPSTDGLVLRTTVDFKGQQTDVELGYVMVAAMRLEEATPCTHDWDRPLDVSSRSDDDVVEGSVARPIESEDPDDRITIVQTRGNRTAQLLACWIYGKPLLQRRCCLECAVEQAKREGRRQVIVGLEQ